MNSALDHAEKDAKAVLLAGRDGMFCAGFDLKEFEKGVEASLAQARGGLELLTRLYSFPLPLVAACNGHAFGMGAFFLLTADNRIGSRGEYTINLPETMLNMEIPPPMLELVHARISPLHLTRVALQSERYGPDAAVSAGFLDELVEENELLTRAIALAKQLAELPSAQYDKNKQGIRREALQSMRAFSM
jgi:enoyl-CoA hydratase